jgi:small-conductance mechanosensitive channel
MNEGDYLSLFHKLWGDLQTTAVVWQLVALMACLGVAYLASQQVRRRAETIVSSGSAGALRFGKAGISRVAFPLSALLLVFVARSLLKPFLPINLLNIAVPLLLSLAAVRMVVYVLRRAFSEKGWLKSSEKWVAAIVWTVLALYLTGLSGPLVAALEAVQFKLGKTSLDLWMVLHGAFMVVVTILLALWVAGLIEARLAETAIDSSLRAVLVRLSKALATLIAVLLSLSMVGIDVTALSVFGGALGVGLGLGLQKIASNYVSGFIILLDRSIRIGNLIALDASTSGVVTKITTRYTVVKMPTGVEVIVPNEHLVASVVHNQSYTDTRVRLACQITVAYATDLERFFEGLTGLAKVHPRVLAEPAPAALLLNFGDNGIDVELGFWIDDPAEGTRNVRSDLNLSILKYCRDQAIEIPYPQREVRWLNPPAAVAGQN